MNVTLEQWKALISVVDSGGYEKAAEALEKSQSSVTYAVQKLQAQLGVKAFEVKGRKAVLTPTGEFLYRRARALVEEAAATERAAKRLSAGWEAEIGIAVEVAFPTWLLLQCLDAFGKDSPHTRIEVIESVLGGTSEALLTGQAELAITGMLPQGFTGDLLMPIPFLPAAHPAHALHKLGRPVTRQDLRAQRQLVVRESGSRRATRLRVEAAERWTVSHMSTSIEAASKGYGYGWYPEYRIRDEIAAGTLKPLPLLEGGGGIAQLYLVFADRDAAGPGVLRLAAIMREMADAACVQERGRKMKSWFITSGKDETALDLREVPVPEPKAGELLARVKAAGLNRGEFIAGHGVSGSAPKACGIEAAGEVVKVGEGVQGFKPGDRVMGRAAHAFSEFAMYRASDAMHAPAKLSWEEAAGASIAYLTAYDMLWPGGELRAGEWLLVTGASAGVGVASVQLGKLIGASVIGTSGSPEKLKKLAALGLDLGLRNRNGGFEKAVMEATGGKGVNVVVNNVGGSVFAECIRALAYKGRLATVGYVDGVVTAELDILALHSKRLRLYGVSNKMRSAAEVAVGVRGFERDVLPAIASGHVRPVIDKVFAFSELPQAKAYMESNAHLGKIVIKS